MLSRIRNFYLPYHHQHNFKIILSTTNRTSATFEFEPLFLFPNSRKIWRGWETQQDLRPARLFPYQICWPFTCAITAFISDVPLHLLLLQNLPLVPLSIWLDAFLRRGAHQSFGVFQGAISPPPLTSPTFSHYYSNISQCPVAAEEAPLPPFISADRLSCLRMYDAKGAEDNVF